jgi:hypothetical protein
MLLVDPEWAVAGEAERIRLREEQLGTGLCPVGEWMEEFVVLLADDGQVIAETSHHLFRLGWDASEALDLMIVADSPPTPILV